MINVIIQGCNGRMGRVIEELISEYRGMEVVAGIDVTEAKGKAYPVYTSLAEVKEDADVVIDFSSPKATPALLTEAVNRKIALVLCATGYTNEEIEIIKEASKKVAILRSANMSLGINTVVKILSSVSRALSEAGFDVEIVEKHHRNKLDAPSGTALYLADAVNDALSEKFEYVFDRSERREKRHDDEIGISAVRGGSIVGEHEVIFAGTDEVIEIRHTAYSRTVFGKGAVEAARFLAKRRPGMYTMKDVIG